MEMQNKIEVGQELVYVVGDPSARRTNPPRTVRVEKIGHKWIYISNGKRLHHANLHADGGQYQSPGKCYLRLEDYQAERAHEIAWSALKKRLNGLLCGIQ